MVKEHLKQTTQTSGWKWPKKPIFFLSDPHADAEAFLASLLATGGIKPPKQHDKIKLTRLGQRAHFVIGGDCLDKGPSNLRLLESIRALYRAGAKVTLIAGNHDMRLLMGLRALEGQRSVLTEHLFVRMGKKVVPLIAEVFTRYVAPNPRPKNCPSLDACRRALYPRNDWFYRFPQAVEGRMPPEAIARELERMGKKIKTFEAECLEYGMTLQTCM
jgi:DNA repair exonuclease